MSNSINCILRCAFYLYITVKVKKLKINLKIRLKTKNSNKYLGNHFKYKSILTLNINRLNSPMKT